MADGLKEEVVTVPKWGGRDDGKKFKITEMPAARAEKWALRLFLAMKGTSGTIPDEVAHLGMVGVAIRGLNAILQAPVRFEDVEPLLDEMFTCIRIIRDPRHIDATSDLMPDDILDVKTRGWLRSEVLRVHTGFSFTDALSSLASVRTSVDTPTT